MKLSKILFVSSVLTGLTLLSRQLFFYSAQSLANRSQDDLSLDEESIRDIAQQIWESEGKPEGQAARHWAMAIELLTSAPPAAPYAYSDKKSIH